MFLNVWRLQAKLMLLFLQAKVMRKVSNIYCLVQDLNLAEFTSNPFHV